MFKKIFSVLSCLILNLSGNTLEISSRDSVVLETFFREAIGNYLYGYTLYGNKPVCIDGYTIDSFYSSTNDFHKLSVKSREGLLVWEKITENYPPENILIHSYRTEDPFVKGAKYILCINKNLFLKTVADNIILFQYILGPTVTPQTLLKKLIDPNESFNSILNNDRTLIGIILGYGTQNAIYVSRCENIAEYLTSSEFPPFINHLFRNGNSLPEHIKLNMLLSASIDPAMHDLKPSLGYSSLESELQDLQSKILTASTKLLNRKPQFFFGHLNDEENLSFLSELEKTQEKIQNLLASENFLSEVLKLIYPNETIIIHKNSPKDNPLSFEKSELEKIPFVIALELWKQISDESLNAINSFLEGMQAAENNTLRTFSNEDFLYCEKYKTLKIVYENLKNAEEYLQKIATDTNYTSIVSDKLYYKTLQEGSGEPLTTQKRVTLHYSIKTPSDKVYVDTRQKGAPQSLLLSETIPGFAWSVKGMKVGEIREVVMHPSFGYGIYTPLEKGVYLRAVIQLIEYNSDENAHSPLSELDLSCCFETNNDQEFCEKEKKVAAAYGYEAWKHYKQCRWVTLPQVIAWLEKFKTIDSPITPLENHSLLINRIHWHIYRDQDLKSLTSDD